MAEIKLYGNAVNGDGKYLISPFDIAAPKADGKTAYTEDDKADDKNIVSYINSKVASLTSGIGAVKTGLQSGSFVEGTLSPAAGDSAETTLIITAKDGSTVKPKLSIGLPSADTIVTGASSYTNLVTEFKKLQTYYTTLDSTVTTINGASTGYRKGDTDTLDAAKKYADDKVSNLGSVYHIEGTKTVAEIKALTNVKKGSVYNVSEAFLLDGKPYPEYTNIVFLKDAATVTWDSNKGFDGTQVDALGGVQDLSAYALNANTVKYVGVTIAPDTTLGVSDKEIALIRIQNGGSTFIGNVGIKAKLPENLITSNKTDAAYINMQSKDFKLGLTHNLTLLNKGSITAEPMSYSNISASLEIGLFEESNVIPTAYISIRGELGTTYQSNGVFLPTAVPGSFGIVRAGDGINVNDGTISVVQNEFIEGDGISITQSVMPSGGARFNIGLDGVKIDSSNNCTVMPLFKTKFGLGVEVINQSGSYVYIDTTTDGNSLSLNTSKLNNALANIESRITSLETLLSLA